MQRGARREAIRVKKSAPAQDVQTYVAMIAVALWSCTLLALARARIYDRCELARDLLELGVDHNHVSTWVCIAYHESRFDTAANNPYSGDHGIFQISELYWCGFGKACGVPCSAFRDDDISDDLRCAQYVHQEHTRLQGDGFLAWVVYPQHCKHNTKKYLADCNRSRNLKTTSMPYRNLNVSVANNPSTDMKPAYLSINSIVREGYEKLMKQNNNHNNWINYKIDNIDELTLPVFTKSTAQPSKAYSIATTSLLPAVTERVPSNRAQLNKFQNTLTFLDFVSKPEQDSKNVTAETTTTVSPTVTTVTSRSTTAKTMTEATTKYNVPSTTSGLEKASTAITKFNHRDRWVFRTTTKRPRTQITAFPRYNQTTTTVASSTSISTTNKPWSPFRFSTETSSVKPLSFTKPSPVNTTPATTTRETIKPTTGFKFVFTRPPPTKPETSTEFTTVNAKPIVISTENPRYTTLVTQTVPQSTVIYSSIPTRSPFITFGLSTPRPRVETTTRSTIPNKTTQSIFDLYLNPTKRTKLPTFDFSPISNSRYKLNIFSRGTTAAPPSRSGSRNPKTASENNAHNQLRRQISGWT